MFIGAYQGRFRLVDALKIASVVASVGSFRLA